MTTVVVSPRLGSPRAWARAPSRAHMTTGTVKWINESKGFGLIAPDSGGEDLFARFWVLRTGDSSESLKEKQKVSFDVTADLGGGQAVNVKPIA